MINKYPIWKYLLILFVVCMGFIYALPNLYPADPAVQITNIEATGDVDEAVMAQAEAALASSGIQTFGVVQDGKRGLLRLSSSEDQLAAKSLIAKQLGDDYIVALNNAATTPDWLESLGAGPMKLGLDLSGGVHFLLEVDTAHAVNKRLEAVLVEIKKELRKEKIRGRISLSPEGLLIGEFKTDELRDSARSAVRKNIPELEALNHDEDGKYLVHWNLPANVIDEIEDYAVSQNLTTLRNRVNELGVAEPLVQRQGQNRIVIQLPGVQDTAQAKKIIGKTANLEFRLEARDSASGSNKQAFSFRDESRPYKANLERAVVITGENVTDAQPGFDENGRPQVNITLDGDGATRMNAVSSKNVGRALGVLFIERKTQTDSATGEKIKYDQKEIISLATIQSALGRQFRITGLDSPLEASELALLLRAGALAAPIDFAEERTVGPSLGAENIELGVKSVQIGFALVLVFMLVYYKAFGLFANIGLSINLVLMMAIMSILSATLTLPGIAGIVLTVGMAVDANVLIFSRIKEEIAAGLSPQRAIHEGFDRAFVTILDANITTFIVAVLLFAVGTGPVKGFAVTLMVGIITSMFTAIMGTRALVNLTYGSRNVKKLWI